MLTDYVNWTSEMSIQRKSYKFNLEEMKDEIKIGDLVQLISYTNHNSDDPKYDMDNTFSKIDLGLKLRIIDITKNKYDKLSYKVRCKEDYTYLRYNAFRLCKNQIEEPLIHEDLSYLIPFLKKHSI